MARGLAETRGAEQPVARGNCREPEEAELPQAVLPEEAVVAGESTAAADTVAPDMPAPDTAAVDTAAAGIAVVDIADLDAAAVGSPGADSLVAEAVALAASVQPERPSQPSRHKMGIRNKKGQLLFRTSDISR